MKTNLRKNKLTTYLAVTAGIGCASSAANAAVIFYGINAANDTGNADPLGISIGTYTYTYDGTDYFYGDIDSNVSNNSFFPRDSLGQTFTRGTDIVPESFTTPGSYISGVNADLIAGAILGSNNYANISFDGNDGVYEAVGQFNITGNGDGFLIAIATSDDGSALSISAGRALIDAAAVPEPSSLALLALGATGLAARRRRKAA